MFCCQVLMHLLSLSLGWYFAGWVSAEDRLSLGSFRLNDLVISENMVRRKPLISPCIWWRWFRHTSCIRDDLCGNLIFFCYAKKHFLWDFNSLWDLVLEQRKDIWLGISPVMGVCLTLSLREFSRFSLQYKFITMLRACALGRGIVEGLTIALTEDALSRGHTEHASTLRSWATAPLPGKDENTVGGWWAEWTSPQLLFQGCFYSEHGRENWRLSQLCVGWQGVSGDAMEGGRRKLFNSLAWWQEIVGLELSHFQEVLVMDT